MKYLLHDESILSLLKTSPYLTVFLDFDGTLVPHASAPDKIVVPSNLVQYLADLARMPGRTVGLISGRSVADLLHFIPLPDSVIVAGNHGLEWMIHGTYGGVALPDGYKETLKDIFDALVMYAKDVPGLEIEWKDLTISAHLRMVDSADRKSVSEAIISRIHSHPASSRVLELVGMWDIDVRPAIAWTKADAIGYFLQNMSIVIDKAPLVYAGDDVTDRDVFRAFSDAVTIHVGGGDSFAKYFVHSVEDMLTLLDMMTKKNPVFRK